MQSMFFENQDMQPPLLDLFHAHAGIVCMVGAGGKKTTMFRLAAEHQGRVGITATAHIEHFPASLPAQKLVMEQADLRDEVAAATARVVAFATPSGRTGRHAGIETTAVADFKTAGRFDLVLIKADGARGRLIKAPAEHEPVLPAAVDTVIPVVSAKVIGRKLTQRLAHRPEQIGAVTGLQLNDVIEPVHVARLLADPAGSLKHAGTAQVVPLINMVDNAERYELAHAAAIEALQLTDRFDYVVLASMRAAEPIVEVVRR
ncbi:MAG: selenium cofactor biosynthesis protein YqeC [Gammaproteobacteria bacterium]